MIRLNQVHKFFNRGKQNEIHVIDDITLNLPDHGICAIFGPSGCGKTTLLNVIGGLDKYASGEVLYDEQNLAMNTDELRNRYTGFIFQNYNLNKEETVFDNVADALRLCGMKDEEQIRSRVLAALRNVGMDKYIKRTPDTLSGGQQQRVAIARAIVKNPRVILADEPTGNLDEGNTILVMDILKELSREHLILLVTHEENLVDFYCDTVIELRDGCVVGIRSNDQTNGYVARDKNTIYLGEMEKKEVSDGNVDVAYYGDAPAKPVSLTVINQNGRLFVRINTPGVSVVDEYSETRIAEGVFTENARAEEKAATIDMSELPPFEGSEYGKLFTFKSSVKSGYLINYKSIMSKKGKKRLRNLLFLFAMVIVFATAAFGTGLRSVFEIKEQYNNNVCYVTANSKNIAAEMRAAMADPASGIDGIRIVQQDLYRMFSDPEYPLKANGFESYSPSNGVAAMLDGSNGSATLHGTMFGQSVLKDPKVVAGSLDSPFGDKNLIITTAVADKILEEKKYEYLTTYDNLIGMYGSFDSRRFDFRVGAVIESDETAVYYSDLVLAVMDLDRCGNILPDSENRFALGERECVCFYAEHFKDEINYTEGDVIKINGEEFTIKKIIMLHADVLSSGITEEEMAVENYLSTLCGFNGNRLEYVVMNEQTLLDVSKYYGTTMDKQNAEGDYSFSFLNSRWEANERQLFYMIHSKDIEKTSEYLKTHFGSITLRDFGDFSGGIEFGEKQPINKAVYTPDDLYDYYFGRASKSIFRPLIFEGVILAIMCVCMYFIMKSTIMNRIREIGIYRAIGVTKKNVIFRFAVEAGVMVTFSVYLGFLFASGVVWYMLHKSSLIKELFFYPIWLALIILVFLYAATIICGIIPVLGLTRKTPSEILAKYDI